MDAASTSRDSGIDIRRLTLGVRLCGDPQRLDPVVRRLQGLARGRLGTALAGVRLDREPSDDGASGSGLIFVERLAVECSGNTAWDDDRLVSQVARQLALALQRQLGQPGVLHFRDRADYVAAAMLAIAQGRLAQCWWFDEFDGLRPLAASAALRTLVIDEAGDGAAALARLAPAALDEVLRPLGDGDASRLIAWLSTFDAGGTPAFEALWSGALQLQREGDAPLRWLKALVASERATPASMGARSLRLLRTMLALLRRAGAGEAALWLQARDRRTLEALLPAPGDSEMSAWLNGLSDSQFESVRAELEQLAATREAATRPLLATRYGGFFLLLARVHRLGWVPRFQAALQQRRPEWTASRRDALCRTLACRISAVALAPVAGEAVLNDPAIAAACALDGAALDGHPELCVAALRSALRPGSAPAIPPAASACRAGASGTHAARLVTEAAALVLAELGRALPGLAGSSPAFLREHALSLAAVIEPAPAPEGPLPSVVRLGRAPLDVLLVLSGVKRQDLALPGIAAIQLREDYSA